MKLLLFTLLFGKLLREELGWYKVYRLLGIAVICKAAYRRMSFYFLPPSWPG